MNSFAHIPAVDGRPPSPAVFACFETLAPVLLEFASRHSLLVRKFYRDQPMWTFHFLHPKGGFGTVQIHAMPLQGMAFKAAIASHWWIDDEEKLIRSSLPTPVVTLQGNAPADVRSALGEALSNVLMAERSGLSRTSPIMPRNRDRDGRLIFSEFERAQRLPT